MSSQAHYSAEADAAQFRLKAKRVRRQLRLAVDAEVIRQLSKIADEYDLLASAFDALGLLCERSPVSDARIGAPGLVRMAGECRMPRLTNALGLVAHYERN